MANSGTGVTTPGKQFREGEQMTRASLNQLGTPIFRLAEGSVGERELISDAVKKLVPSVFRNALINGNFDVWQRGGLVDTLGAVAPDGTPITYSTLPETLGTGASAEYTADRWLAQTPSGSSSREITRASFRIGQSAVPNEPSYYLQWRQLASTATVPILSQSIEDVRTFAGKSVTLTWWMQSDMDGTVTCSLLQYFGSISLQTRVITASSGSSAVLIADADWRQYEAHFEIPPLSEAFTISGTGHSLTVKFAMPANQLFRTRFAQVQLEASTAASDYETLSYQQELTRCERYYEIHGGYMHAGDISVLAFPVQLTTMTTSAIDLVTNYIPGYKFKLDSMQFITTVAGTGASASQILNLEINTTNTTGGLLTLTLASQATVGVVTSATAITAANTGASTDSFSVEVAASGVVFTAGAGILLVKIRNLEIERPCFYFATRKYTSPVLSLVTGYSGTGATFTPILNVGYFQDLPNSVTSPFYLTADAELYGS